MPILFGTTVLTASYDEETYVLSITGKALGINEYVGTSDIQVSLTGVDSWTSVDSVNSWADEAAEGSFLSALADGTYDVRAVSSDGEISAAFEGAFTIGTGAVGQFFFFSREGRK